MGTKFKIAGFVAGAVNYATAAYTILNNGPLPFTAINLWLGSESIAFGFTEKWPLVAKGSAKVIKTAYDFVTDFPHYISRVKYRLKRQTDAIKTDYIGLLE